mmetsp:Transcript_15466/g.34543  ORF Transcript_15466/g.34543 Transcript_15466/m.34543 type:complete len:86 (+) Transcript_15466:2025-2282(+)
MEGFRVGCDLVGINHHDSFGVLLGGFVGGALVCCWFDLGDNYYFRSALTRAEGTWPWLAAVESLVLRMLIIVVFCLFVCLFGCWR